MTPPAATAAERTLRRGPAPRTPRRVSGPVRRAGTTRRAAPAPAPAPAPASRALRLPDARLLDRLVRGRAWIPILALGLLGIVFMQVSMLKLNAGIGRSVTTASTLERQNSALRSQVSRLASVERIQSVARQRGMVLPEAGGYQYVDARRADPRRAARRITAPKPPVTPGSTAAAAPAAGTTAATAPATAPPAAAATPQTAPQAAPTAATAAPPAHEHEHEHQPAPTAPAATEPGATTAGGTSAPAPAPAGGQG